MAEVIIDQDNGVLIIELDDETEIYRVPIQVNCESERRNLQLALDRVGAEARGGGHFFTAAGEEWNVRWQGDFLVEVQDVERRGHEDTYIYAEFKFKNGEFHEHDVENMEYYRAQSVVDEVRAFLNKNGVPR